MASDRFKGRSFSFANSRWSQLGIWVRALDEGASCIVKTNASVVDTQDIAAGTGTLFSFDTSYSAQVPLYETNEAAGQPVTTSSCASNDRCGHRLTDGDNCKSTLNSPCIWCCHLIKQRCRCVDYPTDWLVERHQQAGAWAVIDLGSPKPIQGCRIFNQ